MGGYFRDLACLGGGQYSGGWWWAGGCQNLTPWEPPTYPPPRVGIVYLNGLEILVDIFTFFTLCDGLLRASRE